MRKTLMISAIALGIAAAPAFADDDRMKCGPAPRDSWISVQDARDRVAALGYEVRYVEVDDGCYEVKVRGRDGRKLEVYVHPVTGEIVQVEDDD